MKTLTLAILALLLVLLPVLRAQQGPTKPAVAPTKQVENSEEEIQKPAPFSDQELRVLRSAATLPVERLQELLVVYEKLDNTAMMDALARAILRRDPNNQDALRARGLVEPELETRPVGYLEELGKQVLAGKKVEDTDSVAIQGNALTTDGRADVAVKLLEALRSINFAGKPFPYLDDLAYAYSEAGRLDDAIAAYEKIVTEAGQSSESRAEAQKILPSLRVRKRLDGLRKQAGGDLDKLVELSTKAYRDTPDDYDVIAFRIETLDRARRYEEAVNMLEAMKKKSGNANGWAWQPTLAYAYFGSRRYEQAIAAFREIQKSSAFDPATRMEAESMILEIRVGREIELGMAAMERGDMPGAKAVLDRLLSDYSIHPDTLGYHAIYLAKTGHAQEALRILNAKKAEAQAARLPFSQQDAVADVYMEMKDYRMAIAAAREIIEDPLYDDEMRQEAYAKIREIAITQTLEAGYAALQYGYRADAKGILTRLQQFAPEDLEVKVFAAEVALAYNHAAQARNDLLALKRANPVGPFPGQEALGEAHFRTGEWERSFADYEEILNLPGYEPEDISEARKQLRDLRPLIRPMATLNMEFASEEEGDTIHTEATYSTAWWNDWRFTAFAREDWINLAEGGYFEATNTARFEGGITAQRRFSGGYFAEATIGGTESGVLYGARAGKFANGGIGWSLAYMGNQRSTESVSLQALDGREDRAEFQIAGPIGDRWLMEFAAYYHWIRVGGDRLGQGYGFNGTLDYIIQKETRTRPEITIGYFGEYHRFDSVSNVPPSITKEIRRAVVPQEEVRSALASTEEVRRAVAGSFGREVLDSLVDPETNRHGVRLTVKKHFGDDWAGYVQVGGYYAFDDKSLDYTAAAGVEYYLSEAAMIYAEIRYDSNGRTSSAGVLEANLGALVTF